MTLTEQMIATYPGTRDVEPGPLARCIDDCLSCAGTCVACADACLAEESVAHLRRCITLCLGCADICETTMRIASRATGTDRALLKDVVETCAASCAACGAECEEHARMGMKHCAVCAESCRACGASCRALSAVL